MKLWTLTTFCTVSLLILSGCVAKPSPNKEPIIDKSLQVIELTKTGIIVDSNAIAFEWNSIKDTNVDGVYIYKLKKSSTKGEPTYYATVDNRFATHYLDSDIEPDTQYSYFFKTYNEEAESIKSATVTVNSMPVLQSVAWISSISNMPRSAKIIWRPHSNEKVKAYIIERSTLEEPYWEKIDTIYGRLKAEYIDEKLNDEYTYMYRIRAVTYDNLTSTPSQIVKSVTKALPKEITDLSVSKGLAKKIELKWSKAKIEDFSHYNIYRSTSSDSGYELFAKTLSNTFVNSVEEDGKQYFYRVTTVDKDGLESKYAGQPIQGITLVKPTTPALVEAKMLDNKVKLVWSKTDPRTKSFTVYKRYKKSLFDEVNEKFEGITDEYFIDSKIEPEITYYYRVFAVDDHSIKSKPSIEVEFTSHNQKEASIKKEVKKENIIAKPADTESVEVVEDVIAPIEDFQINER